MSDIGKLLEKIQSALWDCYYGEGPLSTAYVQKTDQEIREAIKRIAELEKLLEPRHQPIVGREQRIAELEAALRKCAAAMQAEVLGRHGQGWISAGPGSYYRDALRTALAKLEES